MSAPSIFRRRTAPFAAVVVGISVLALTGCSGAASSDSTGEAADYGSLNIQLSYLKNTEFAGEYYAVENGYFADAGFDDVTLTAGGSSAVSAEAAVTTGQALIGISGSVATATAIEEGAAVKIIATEYQVNPFSIMSIGDDPIETPEDMIGKTIAVADYNSAVFSAYLEQVGISADEVTVVPFTGTDQLTTGQVDGYLGYTTAGTYILDSAGLDAVELKLADSGMALVAESIVATDDAIQNQPDELEAALVAIIKGWKDALADPEGATSLTVDDYGKDNNYDYDQQLYAFNKQVSLIVTDETTQNGLLTMSDDLQAAAVKTLVAVGIDITAD
ncbi:MAG: ABC transporter substrate-binding protein, partial [Microbacterium sp.]